MTSSYGNKVRITISGESHGPCIEAVLSGIPAGREIDTDLINIQLKRRSPGQDATATPRKEADEPKIISGIKDGVTTGEDIHIIIENTNTHSSDYAELKFTPRPSHADYPAFVKYKGEADMRGSGHFSGRLTAPLTAAGAICKQILKQKGITIGGHVYNIGEVFDVAFDGVTVSEKQLDDLSCKYFATVSEEAKKEIFC